MNETINWSTSSFPALSGTRLYAILRLRTDVFVVEQDCAYPELDGLDLEALHIEGLLNGELLAYARVLPPDPDGMPHIGRVVVAPNARGKGMARALMQQALAAAAHAYGTTRSAISAQAHLVPFYGSLGYRPVSQEYPLDGIPHVDMVREGSA